MIRGYHHFRKHPCGDQKNWRNSPEKLKRQWTNQGFFIRDLSDNIHLHSWFVFFQGVFYFRSHQPPAAEIQDVLLKNQRLINKRPDENLDAGGGASPRKSMMPGWGNKALLVAFFFENCPAPRVFFCFFGRGSKKNTCTLIVYIYVSIYIMYMVNMWHVCLRNLILCCLV